LDDALGNLVTHTHTHIHAYTHTQTHTHTRRKGCLRRCGWRRRCVICSRILTSAWAVGMESTTALSLTRCVAVCCSVFVAACCSVLQRVPACCSVSCVAMYCGGRVLRHSALPGVLQCVAVCLLQCVAACRSVLQRVMSCNVLRTESTTALGLPRCVAVCCSVFVAGCCSVLQRVAACCSVSCLAMCCGRRERWHSALTGVLQCVAACCSVLQHVAVCRVLQCAADGEYYAHNTARQLCSVLQSLSASFSPPPL